MKYFFTNLLILFLVLPAAAKSPHFLSFIMPCYNCSKTVEKSLDSIYEQNIASCNFEVICTDDGSADNTLKILEAYAAKHPNMHIYKHGINKSGGAASNTCIEHAQGDLLFRLDSDNLLAENTIDRLIELLDATSCDGACVEEMRSFIGDKKHIHSIFYRAPHNICDLQHCISTTHNPAHSGNYLFTKDSWLRAGGYPEDHGADTFRFGFMQYATGSRIAILPNSFYWHFYNVAGYWSREEARGSNNRKSLATLLEYADIFTRKTRKKLKKSHANVIKLIDYRQLSLVDQKQLRAFYIARSAAHVNNYNRTKTASPNQPSLSLNATIVKP